MTQLLPPVRAALQQTMDATAADEAERRDDTYEAIRPMPVPTAKRVYVPGRPWVADCSTGVRDVCWWTPGAPDPFRNGWAEYGNSSTIFLELPHLSGLAGAEPGDIPVFGHWNGEAHACMLHSEQAGQWMVWNFGQQGEPVIVPLTREISNHPGMTMTVCRLMHDPPLTHADELRALTGYWPWLAWYLGEGQTRWKPYGPKNPSVRPNVPTTIPDTWWAQEKAFLANREKGNP